MFDFAGDDCSLNNWSLVTIVVCTCFHNWNGKENLRGHPEIVVSLRETGTEPGRRNDVPQFVHLEERKCGTCVATATNADFRGEHNGNNYSGPRLSVFLWNRSSCGASLEVKKKTANKIEFLFCMCLSGH